MWIDAFPTRTDWPDGPVTVARVLYDADSPAIFTAHSNGAYLLFLKQDELSDADQFLAVEVTPQTVIALANGTLSLRGAMTADRAYLLELDFDFNVTRFQVQSFDQYQHGLPSHGVGLFARFGRVPDEEAASEA